VSGTVINQVNVLTNPKDIPIYLAKAVPGQVNHIIPLFLHDLERT
jgi:calcium permeable stress-gated cation channel